MEKITTIQGLIDNEGKEFILKTIIIEDFMVRIFVKLLGDWNGHNEKPIVPDFFSLALFVDFHNQIVKIQCKKPVNLKILRLSNYNPVYANEKVFPVLKILKAKIYTGHTKVEWLYQLREIGSKKLLISSVIERIYKPL